jgi:hypothetical protein
VLTTAITLFLTLLQAIPTGAVMGVVLVPDASRPASAARAVLLPPKYADLWDRQVQTRLDNYWEVYKPEFLANKEHFLDFNRMAQVEGLRYAVSMMRRDLGSDAERFIKDSLSAGQFEFNGVPVGTYQLLVVASINGKDVMWSKSVSVKPDLPTFVDLGKPVS